MISKKEIKRAIDSRRSDPAIIKIGHSLVTVGVDYERKSATETGAKFWIVSISLNTTLHNSEIAAVNHIFEALSRKEDAWEQQRQLAAANKIAASQAKARG